MAECLVGEGMRQGMDGADLPSCSIPIGFIYWYVLFLSHQKNIHLWQKFTFRIYPIQTTIHIVFPLCLIYVCGVGVFKRIFIFDKKNQF